MNIQDQVRQIDFDLFIALTLYALNSSGIRYGQIPTAAMGEPTARLYELGLIEKIDGGVDLTFRITLIGLEVLNACLWWTPKHGTIVFESRDEET